MTQKQLAAYMVYLEIYYFKYIFVLLVLYLQYIYMLVYRFGIVLFNNPSHYYYLALGRISNFIL